MITPTRPNSFGWPPVGRTPISGIGGVLGELISDDLPPPEPTERAKSVAPNRPPQPRPTQSHARAGRPPGKGSCVSKRKEKLTVRIDADLAATYRDWSWDARCNLGELVSQAMQSYLKNRRDS
jgi:uncharacterized protein (DUF4415 family)